MKRSSFNQNWLFYKDSDTDGKAITLPHDAMQFEQRSADAPSGSEGAYYHGGCYRYEKRFHAPAEWKTRHILLQFEGVYKEAEVTLNGRCIGGTIDGYFPFFAELDEALIYDAENVLIVTAKNDKLPNCRWYTGSGIYRPVWLWEGSKNCIPPEGVQIRTISYNPARIQVDIHAAGDITVEILRHGETVATGYGSSVVLDIPNAALWTAETPELYSCRVTLRQEDAVSDTAEERFGIRVIESSPKGFFVNGKSVLLRGGCIHQAGSITGAATYAESEYRRARIMKEQGFNAIRYAHNPANRDFLHACDEIGLYVMDETFDYWYRRKTKHDLAPQFMEHYRQDLQALVSRDFNHPSVVMYSIGNEVSEPSEEKGVELARDMVRTLHSLDATRPVTAGINLLIVSRTAGGKSTYNEDGGLNESADDKTNGMNSTMFNMMASIIGTGMNQGANNKKADEVTSPVLDALDIAGYNYASGRYPLEGKAHPDRVVVGSETFPQDISKNWKMVKKYPYLIGDFMWAGWDYLGEVGVGAWTYPPDKGGFAKEFPWLLPDVGAIDLLGNPNGGMYCAQAAWDQLQKPVIAVQPANHGKDKPTKSVWRGSNAIPVWGWQNCEGSKATVEVYSSQSSVVLFLNDKRLGKKRVNNGKATYKVKYTPGVLRAVSYDAKGIATGESVLETPHEAKLCLSPEKHMAVPGEVVHVNVYIGDADGRIEGNADATLNVTVEGGELLAFGSANPKTTESYVDGRFTTYYGRAMAIVRAGKGEKVKITAASQKETASATIAITEA